MLSLAASLPALGQFQLVPLPREQAPVRSAARTKATELRLPFWDDFSFTATAVPTDSLWQFSRSIWVNNGMGVNPPSLQVATFDGLDSLGKPYNVNDVLAKGFADKLTSQPIRLDLVEPGARASVYLSFFYQFKGRGEAPDKGDILKLTARDKDGKWETLWAKENDGTLDANTFEQVLLPINDERFFHREFQFRFQNFARLSGPYDTWHVDYIYLHAGRSAADTSYPDRTLATTLSSVLGNYTSIPFQHFKKSTALTKPRFTAFNLRADNNQPLNYFSFANVTSFQSGNAALKKKLLDSAQSIGSVPGLQFVQAEAQNKGLLNLISLAADSAHINIKLGLSTKDNVTPDQQGDYDEQQFKPVDFRLNDTLQVQYTLSNYYAYDDGIAEYGAALNQPGAQVAYEFNMRTTDPDTVVAIDLYFPRFGDETSQLIELRIWRDLSETPNSVVYREVFTLPRSEQNLFIRKRLTAPIGVARQFYIGWRQSSAAVVAVGLDKNTDSGDKIFSNTVGVWEKNQILKGSLMLRPVFGKGDKAAVDPINSIADAEQPPVVYPNPSAGFFFLPATCQLLGIYDTTGRSITFSFDAQADKLVVQVHAVAGIYLLKMLHQGRPHTVKLMVQP